MKVHIHEIQRIVERRTRHEQRKFRPSQTEREPTSRPTRGERVQSHHSSLTLVSGYHFQAGLALRWRGVAPALVPARLGLIRVVWIGILVVVGRPALGLETAASAPLDDGLLVLVSQLVKIFWGQGRVGTYIITTLIRRALKHLSPKDSIEIANRQIPLREIGNG